MRCDCGPVAILVACLGATALSPCNAVRSRLSRQPADASCGDAIATLLREVHGLREENRKLLELAGNTWGRNSSRSFNLRRQQLPVLDINDAHLDYYTISASGDYTFALCYWGGVLIFIAACYFLAWTFATMKDMRQRLNRMGVDRGGLEITPRTVHEITRAPELNRDLWGFFLIVCLDQAKTCSGFSIPVWMAGLGNLAMGSMQVCVVFLLMHDINPHTTPITSTPSSPWKETTWTVNLMKWIQVVFMAIALASEVGAAMRLFANSVLIDAGRLRVHRAWPVLTAIGQYVVALCVLFGGVAVVLSFHAVPDILYSSMAIIFISNIDDFMYQYMEIVFELDIDFKIDDEHSHPGQPSDHAHFWPEWLPVIYRVVSLFPLVFAVFLIGQAWYTNQMPNRWIRDAVYPDFKSNHTRTSLLLSTVQMPLAL